LETSLSLASQNIKRKYTENTKKTQNKQTALAQGKKNTQKAKLNLNQQALVHLQELLRPTCMCVVMTAVQFR